MSAAGWFAQSATDLPRSNKARLVRAFFRLHVRCLYLYRKYTRKSTCMMQMHLLHYQHTKQHCVARCGVINQLERVNEDKWQIEFVDDGRTSYSWSLNGSRCDGTKGWHQSASALRKV